MNHIPDETLSAWLEEELSGSKRQAVVDHLADCPRCREEFAALQGVILSAGKLEPEWPGKAAAWNGIQDRISGPDRVAAGDPPRSPHRRFWALAGLASAAVLAAVLLLRDAPAPSSVGIAAETLFAADQGVADEIEEQLDGDFQPEVRRALLSANQEIEHGMSALRLALQERPNDPALIELAQRASIHRIDLLREMNP